MEKEKVLRKVIKNTGKREVTDEEGILEIEFGHLNPLKNAVDLIL